MKFERHSRSGQWGMIAAVVLAAGAMVWERLRPIETSAAPFDLYVLALSWSPSWCAGQGSGKGGTQCADGADHRLVLHGLWPNHENRRGPEDCSDGREPTRAELRSMLDLTPSEGLLRHEWRKHGTCSGLTPAQYFATARKAVAQFQVPADFARLDRAMQASADSIEAAFLAVNPGLRDEMLTLTCKEGRLTELRLCLTPDLQPRACPAAIARDCTAARLLVPAPE